jgi:hypothetical protein
MPIHDWEKASGRFFHHFHQHWTVAICAAVNDCPLPKGVFAMVEKYSGAVEADVLALEMRPSTDTSRFEGRGGAVLLTENSKDPFHFQDRCGIRLRRQGKRRLYSPR